MVVSPSTTVTAVPKVSTAASSSKSSAPAVSSSRASTATSKPRGALAKRIGDSKKLVAFDDSTLGEAWARPLANVWYLRTDSNQDAIEGRLARLLDGHDGLLVQGVREEGAFRNTGLRWFRRRRREEDAAASNVVAFPTPADATYPLEGDAMNEPAPLRAAS